MTDDPRRRTSDWVARRLAEPERLRATRRRQRAGLFRDPSSIEPESDARTPAPTTPGAISIWQPREVEGEWIYERPPVGIFGDHYAARRQIRSGKSEGRRRICLFGESVAAGYLYAPHLTPAQVLERQLDALSPRPSYEVLDFSRTNETLDSLLHSVGASLQLAPDALVVFAGNNWPLLEQPGASPYAPSVEGRLSFAHAVRRGGLSQAADDAGRSLLQRVGEALAELERLAGTIPVFLLVPEVNLRDWENRQPVPWLPGDGIRRWYELYGEARRALLDGSQSAILLGLCDRMLDLDGALCPTTHRVVAHAARVRAEEEEVVAAACRREIAVSDPATAAFLAAPRITPMLQELLRRGARHHGFSCIDLPRIFARHTGSPLTDRRLFLDYCHLTREGMKIAMAATAAEVLRRLEPTATVPEWTDLVALLPPPEVSASADATAKLGAALHTAHRLLPISDSGPLLEHWCREALSASEGIAEVMLDLVETRSSPCPTHLGAAQQHNLESPCPLTPQHGWCWEGLDLDALGAVLGALRERGRELGDEVDRRLLRRRRVGGTEELAHGAAFLRQPLERLLPDVMDYLDLPGRALFRAAWPSSRFVLLADGDRPMELEATFRTPFAAGSGRSTEAALQIEINGHPLGRLAAGRSWRRATLSIEPARLRRGGNEITLRWPWPTIRGELAIEEALSRLELGREAEIHPIFGELFSLRATAG